MSSFNKQNLYSLRYNYNYNNNFYRNKYQNLLKHYNNKYFLYNNKYVIYYCIGAEGESRTRTGCPTGV